jgi:hypothetical protein
MQNNLQRSRLRWHRLPALHLRRRSYIARHLPNSLASSLKQGRCRRRSDSAPVETPIPARPVISQNKPGGGSGVAGQRAAAICKRSQPPRAARVRVDFWMFPARATAGPNVRVHLPHMTRFACSAGDIFSIRTRVTGWPNRAQARTPQGHSLRIAAPKPKDLPRPVLPAGVPRAAGNDGGRSFAVLRMTVRASGRRSRQRTCARPLARIAPRRSADTERGTCRP